MYNNKKITEKILNEVSFNEKLLSKYKFKRLFKCEEILEDIFKKIISLAIKEKDAEIKKAIDKIRIPKEVPLEVRAYATALKEELKQKLNLK